MTTPLTISEFHGGITDNDVDNGLNKYKKADNLLVTASKKLESREGSVIFDTSWAQCPSGLNRISGIIDHDKNLLFCALKNIYSYSSTTGFTELNGPTGNDAFSNGDANGFFSWGTWNHITYITYDDVTSNNFLRPIKIYRDGSNNWQLRTAGLPLLIGSTLSGTAGSNVFTYLIGYYYEYTVGTITWQDWGPLTRLQYSNDADPATHNITISTIPVLANSTTYNYDTTNIKIKIFRTQANGTDFTLVDTINNGTTSYVDDNSDASIVNNEAPYTSDGTLDNDPPPLAKYIHIANNKGWYGHIKEGSEIFSNRLMQSVNNDIDSVPATAYIDLEDSINGISSHLDRVIVLCSKYIYRVDGAFDEIGGGELTQQRISDSAGCLSHNSIVQIPEGIVWAGNNGFYFSDGFQVLKISGEFSDSYAQFTQTATQKRRIYGCYDPLNHLVYWSVQTESGAVNDCDMHYVFDTSWGIANGACFTTASGGDNYAPTACIFNDTGLVRGDKRGFIFQHSEDYYSDPKVDTSLVASQWDIAPITWHYISMATSFDSLMFRKFVPRICVEFLNKSNLSLQIISNNDLSDHKVNLKPIRYRGNDIWGDPLKVFGTPTDVWNGSALIEEQRRLAAGTLRCSYKQIELTNAHVVITSSDERGEATVNSASKTVQLNSSDFIWPSNCVDQYISFETDSYEIEYLIVNRTDTILTIANTVYDWVASTTYEVQDLVNYNGKVYECSVANSDGTFTVAHWTELHNSLTSGSQKWMIKGIPRNEKFYLLAYTLHYSMLGKTQKVFTKASTGELND